MLMQQVSAEENRQIQRISMSLPIKVEIRLDQKKTWEETTYIKDVSSFGAGFFLSRPVVRGRLINLTISMPCKLRLYDLSDAQYKIWGVVRRCISINSGAKGEAFYSVGVGFIGKFPPESYTKNPLTIYEIASRNEDGFWVLAEDSEDLPETALQSNRRIDTRFKIPTNVTVEILDDEGNEVAVEDTVTENLSFRGAAIFCSFPVEIGYFVRVISEQYSVSIISIVRGVHIGDYNIQRIHVEFIDRFFPLEGVD